jgi:hypothetical protein
MHVAKFHMKEEAQYWFYNTVHDRLFYDWESFVRELQYQFRKELQEELEADRRLREADQRLHQELPNFDGYKVSAWIHKANQVFNYHRSPMYARVCLASFHMIGEALLWFKNAGQSSGGWEEFLDGWKGRSFIIKFYFVLCGAYGWKGIGDFLRTPKEAQKILYISLLNSLYVGSCLTSPYCDYFHYKK